MISLSLVLLVQGPAALRSKGVKKLRKVTNIPTLNISLWPEKSTSQSINQLPVFCRLHVCGPLLHGWGSHGERWGSLWVWSWPRSPLTSSRLRKHLCQSVRHRGPSWAAPFINTVWVGWSWVWRYQKIQQFWVGWETEARVGERLRCKFNWCQNLELCY